MTPRIRTAQEASAERNKTLEVPNDRRNIRVKLFSDGGRVIFVSDPRRARVLERADRFLARERSYKR